MSRSKDLADSAEVINFLDNITTDINSGLTSKLSISTNLSDLADADAALVNLGLTATATELNYVDGVTSAIQTQLDSKLASASYTASDVLTKVKTVDGAASGLDADLLDGQQGSYYTSYTDTAISNLVDSAPGALDTLNELAAALGDDANFSTTVTNSIALKAPLASPTFTGTVTIPAATVTGDISFGDSDKAIFGNSNDLQIYHDGSHSRILHPAASGGDFYIQADDLYLTNAIGNTYVKAISGGAVTLAYSNSDKLRTTSTGIDVTGTVTADGLVVDGGTTNRVASFISTDASALIEFADNTTTNRPAIGAEGNDMTFSTNGEKVRIDNSGNVGIGTSSPQYLGHFVNGDIGIVSTDITNNAEKQSLLFGGASGESAGLAGITGYRGAAAGIGELIFKTNQGSGMTEVMRIDSSGNVGIGTDDPSETLMVSGTGSQYIRLQSDDNSGSGIYFGNTGSTDRRITLSSSNLLFENSNGSAEYMRLDSSGHLLVGTTNSGAYAGTTSGAGIRSEGIVFGSRAAVSGIFNRHTSDGEVIQFRKDGTTVGSIGVGNNNRLTIGTGDTGLMFDGVNNAVFPWDISTNAVPSSDRMDLGYNLTGLRFKDLYLAGDIAHLDTAGNARLLYDRSSNLLGNQGTNLSVFSAKIGSEVVLSESADRADLLQISSTTSSWGGLQIRNSSNEGRWSFMTDGETAGIYNDEDNQWHIQMTEVGGVGIYYAGATKLATTAAGVTITGTATTTSLNTSGNTFLGYATLTADSQNDVVLFSADGSAAQSGAFHNKLIIKGGASQTRDLQLYQEVGGFAWLDSSYASNSLNISSNFTALNVNTTLNINGNLNAVDNIYLAGSLYHEGDTDTRLLFGTNLITLQTGGSSEITVNTTGVRLGDSGNGYFQPVTGNYGSIQADGGAHGGWEGYSIGGRAVFMHDNSSTMGLYDDVNNHWAFKHTLNGATELYHDGTARLTTNSTGANVTGTMSATAFSGDGSALTNLPASGGGATFSLF